MTWDSVPWMVGGGAHHSVNVARNVSYAAFGGREGIVNPPDLEVRELAVPGTSVRVLPGTCGILNRAAGARDEMYVGRLPVEDTVAIAATTAGSGRSDLIVARVEDPHLAGEPWAAPADPETGPYIYTRVISNVPASTTTAHELGLGHSMVALARIDLPPSTGTVTQDMIVDLRLMGQTRVHREFNLVAPSETETLTTSSFTNWPDEANFTLDVPEWATDVKVRAFLAGIKYGGDGDNNGSGWNVNGELRIQIGQQSGDANYSQATQYNMSVDSGRDRGVLMCGAPKMDIPLDLRGTRTTIRIEGKKISGSTALEADNKSMVSIDVEFVNAVETYDFLVK